MFIATSYLRFMNPYNKNVKDVSKVTKHSIAKHDVIFIDCNMFYPDPLLITCALECL